MQSAATRSSPQEDEEEMDEDDKEDGPGSSDSRSMASESENSNSESSDSDADGGGGALPDPRNASFPSARYMGNAQPSSEASAKAGRIGRPMHEGDDEGRPSAKRVRRPPPPPSEQAPFF